MMGFIPKKHTSVYYVVQIILNTVENRLNIVFLISGLIYKFNNPIRVDKALSMGCIPFFRQA